MMGTHSIIEHRARYHYLRIEDDFVQICKEDHCQAALLAVLEQWTNWKLDRGEGTWIRMTLGEFERDLYNLFKRKKIAQCLEALQRRKLILVRTKKDAQNQTFCEYRLNIEIIHKMLRKLPEKPVRENEPQKPIPTGGVSQKGRGVSQKGHIIESSIESFIESPQGKSVEKDSTQMGTVESPPEETSLSLWYEVFSSCKQEVTGNPKARYRPTPKDDEALKTLPEEATPETVKEVYLRMWNLQDKDGKHFWRDKMTIQNVCRHYEEHQMALQSEREEQEQEKAEKEKRIGPYPRLDLDAGDERPPEPMPPHIQEMLRKRREAAAAKKQVLVGTQRGGQG